jgi:Tfp pilus assembly protein PilO
MAAQEIGERQLLAITALVFAVVLLVVGTFIFLSYRQYSKLEKERQAFRQEIAGYDVIRARGPAAEKKLEESQADLRECEEYLPAEENVQQMLKSINDNCLESALESVNLKQDMVATPKAFGAVKKQLYETIRYRCEFRGNFHQLARFIGRVENWKHFKRFANIQSFNMQAANRGLTRDDNSQRHKITMTLEVYRYSEPPKPAGTAVGAPTAGTR